LELAVNQNAIDARSWASDRVRDLLQKRLSDAEAALRNCADSFVIASAQTEVTLYKFSLQQSLHVDGPMDVTSKLFVRDQGSVAEARRQIVMLAEHDSTAWIIWGLSFADFRFHLFPIGHSLQNVPLCVSPMLCICLDADVVAASETERVAFSCAQWDLANWSSIEARLHCLSEPLDVFDNAQDCSVSVCLPRS
jgi:hypothetical protein